MKKITTFVALVILLMFSLNISVCASSRQTVENILENTQDYLFFGSVGKVNKAGEWMIDVELVIGDSNRDDENENAGFKTSNGVLEEGETIEVLGFSEYMYFDKDYRSPKIGDNVLLSVDYENGNYKIKNGAFWVNQTNIDSFMFHAPEKFSADSEAELTALYMFVRSNGKNADYIIRDDKVLTHEDGKEKNVSVPQGIYNVDKNGNITKKSPAGHNSSFDLIQVKSRWIYAILILVVGSLVGVFITRLFVKFEQRSDK